ncbi:MAG: hypothetical protein IKJ99_09770 [Oscillospiraceae bacterium]|nr:hypothetical protein [Oscillospiraceae bacterium]
MRNKNAMGKMEYIWQNIYWTFLALLLYTNFLFVPVFAFNLPRSLQLLTGCVVLGMCVGILLTLRRRRNYLTVACNLLLAYGIYHSAALWFIDRKLFFSAGLAVLVLVVGYVLLVLVTYFADRREYGQAVSLWKCIRCCFPNCRTLMALVLAVTMIFTAAGSMLGFSAMEIQEGIVSSDTSVPEDEGETLSKNQEQILLLDEEVWRGLDIAERLRVMKAVADIEAGKLGIPEVGIRTEALDEHILGHYNDADRTITLNLGYLGTEDAQTMLKAVCHEIYHAYQFRMVELYNQLSPEQRALVLFDQAERYRAEFENYIDGTDDYDAYIDQRCEADSNAYAEEAAEEYDHWLQLHQNEGKTEEDA